MKYLISLLVICTVLLSGCSASSAQKEVDAAQAAVDQAKAAAQADPSNLAKQEALAAAQIAYSAAVTRYTAAKDSDDTRWGAIATLVGIGSAALGIPLGGLVDPFRKLITGRAEGAAIATTAITNADTKNTLQDPATRDAVLAGLAGAHPKVAAAVSTNL